MLRPAYIQQKLTLWENTNICLGERRPGASELPVLLRLLSSPWQLDVMSRGVAMSHTSLLVSNFFMMDICCHFPSLLPLRSSKGRLIYDNVWEGTRCCRINIGCTGKYMLSCWGKKHLVNYVWIMWVWVQMFAVACMICNGTYRNCSFSQFLIFKFCAAISRCCLLCSLS